MKFKIFIEIFKKLIQIFYTWKFKLQIEDETVAIKKKKKLFILIKLLYFKHTLLSTITRQSSD